MPIPPNYKVADACHDCRHYNEYTAKCELHNYHVSAIDYCDDYDYNN